MNYKEEQEVREAYREFAKVAEDFGIKLPENGEECFVTDIKNEEKRIFRNLMKKTIFKILNIVIIATLITTTLILVLR